MSITALSWRNLLRKPTRSLLLLLSMALGVWAGIFTMAFYGGLNAQRVKDKVQDRLGHVQVHPTAWVQETDLVTPLTGADALHARLRQAPEVAAFSSRLLLPSTVRTAHGTAIVQVQGIDPAQERNVTAIQSQVVQGDYFLTEKKVPLVIGEALAEQLQAQVGSSIVLDFQYPAGTFQSLKGKVVGIYRTHDSRFDAQQVFVTHAALHASGVAQPGEWHEVGMVLHDADAAPALAQQLAQEFPGLSVREWRQVAPELSYINDYQQLSMAIFMAVVMVAVGFVILNNLLMMVLERRREMAMLRALGMKARQVFGMVQLETLFLALAGGPLGALLGYATVSHFGGAGIHVPSLEEGLSAFGISSAIHPQLQTHYYFLITLGILLTAFIASAWPAWRAAKGR